MICKFLSSISHPNVCLILSFQTEEALFASLRLTFYARLLHLMAMFRCVSDLKGVIALC